jgi:hypothetical protein
VEQQTITPAYRDRSGGLVAFGILELLFGLACLGFVALLFLAGPPPNSPSPRPNIVPAALTYLVLAVVFFFLGVGSIRVRRWARTLSLIVGWFWLLVGVVGGVFLIFFMPRLFAALPRAHAQPGARAAATGCLATVWGIFLVLLPIGFVLFYGSRNVRATCEARDPRPRWTDRCPAPVLALALMSAFAAVSFVVYSVHPTFPIFGRLWTGAPGTLLFLLFALLEAAVAWGLYRLLPAAWWGRLGLWLLNGVSTAYTFHRGIDWGQLLRASGQPESPATLQMLQSLFTGPYFLALLVGIGIAFVGYLIWVRKYFVPRPAEP